MSNESRSSPVTNTAAWLMNEHTSGRDFTPFASKRGILTMTDAYAVQEAYVKLKAEQNRVGRAGYKIGLTSLSMQAMCGIDTPVAGTVFADTIHSTHARLRASEYGRLGVEFEVAVRLGKDLHLGDYPLTLKDVEDALDGVAPAMEIVDDRNCNYKELDVLSLVADNAWNAGIVVGSFVSEWPDLASVEGSVHIGTTKPVERGRGTDVLGHPLAPVVWLANHLSKSGVCLRAGEIVMTGSMVTTKFPLDSEHFRFEVYGVGAVDFDVQF